MSRDEQAAYRAYVEARLARIERLLTEKAALLDAYPGLKHACLWARASWIVELHKESRR